MTHQASRPRALFVRQIEGAIDTASAFQALFAQQPYAFWLDSAPGSGGRYSLLGTGTTVLTGGFDRLRQAIRETVRNGVSIPPELPAELACGWVGFFGYEPGSSAWLVPDRFLVVDHTDDRSWAVAANDPDWPELAAGRTSLRSGDGSGSDSGDDFGNGSGEPSSDLSVRAPSGDRRSDRVEQRLEPWLVRDRERYLADIEACLAYLRAGESYEICLTNTVELPYPERAEDPLTAYLRLRRTNPAPYAAFLRFDDRYVLSASPERFLTVDADGTACSSPIKGTAARSADPDEDAARAKELATDEKTRAENLMIVDLVRNDLGRVCRPGSIQVPSFLAVRSYATVHQLVSTVRGRLRAEVGPVGAAEACFPPGSMTGAPKPRTMRIIDELEGRPRGVYSGALGFFGLAGTADLSVVIRTAVIDRARQRATIGAGGAIVLDSDPELEYAEMVMKAAVPFRALRPGPVSGG